MLEEVGGMNMAKIKVSILNSYTLRLEEKGEVGDLIDLHELQKVDNTLILDAIEQETDRTYQSLLAKEVQQQKSNQQIALNALEKKLQEESAVLKQERDRLALLVESFEEKLKETREIVQTNLHAGFAIEKGKLENKIDELQQAMESQKRVAILETEQRKDSELNKKIVEYQQILSDKQNQIQELSHSIQTLNEKQTLLIDVEKGKVKSQFESLVSEKEKRMSELLSEIEKQKTILSEQTIRKENEINLLKIQLANKEELLKLEIEKATAELKQTYIEELNQKELEISQLKLAKSSLQVKTLGEELERWCNSEYEAYALSGFDNCKWYKDNKSVKDSPDGKATKADYIFEVYADARKNESDKLLSVCCEMKNESPDTKTKTKNADHYKKLEEDRIKKNCQYSLLISELEWNTVNDVPIKKIAEYENMYLVRPAYFMSFLSLMKSLANKYQDLLLEHRIANEAFQEGQAIIHEFENFKTTYLDKPLASLLKDVEEIKKEANKAYESSYKIVGLADTIISNKIAEIKIKIERFDIRKIAKKVDKINQL